MLTKSGTKALELPERRDSVEESGHFDPFWPLDEDI